jgi:hypothetical protein
MVAKILVRTTSILDNLAHLPIHPLAYHHSFPAIAAATLHLLDLDPHLLQR